MWGWKQLKLTQKLKWWDHDFEIPCSTLRNHCLAPPRHGREEDECPHIGGGEGTYGEHQNIGNSWIPLYILATSYWRRWRWSFANQIHGHEVCLDRVGWNDVGFDIKIYHCGLHKVLRHLESEGNVWRTWMGSTPIFKMFMLCKSMMLVAFGMPMWVKRKLARMEEHGCCPHEVQGKYTNFRWERPPICTILHQRQWREHSKFLHIQG